MLTAHLSTKRKPGAVFLVSNMHAGHAASDIACTEWWTVVNIKIK
jgi:hypothetical protein